MLVGMFFLHFFANFMKMCSPPSVGSTFPKNSFCNDRVQEAVSIPKLASKPPLMGGHFRLVPCKLYYVLPSERKRAQRRGIERANSSKMDSKLLFLEALCLESFFKNVLPTEGGEQILQKTTNF